MKKEIKEKIIEILKKERVDFTFSENRISDQILALFEEEKKKWAEEREKTIDKIEKLSRKVFGRIPIKGVIK